MNFRPLHDRVLVRRVTAEEKTAGGIIIPDTAKEKPQEGEVVSVGPGTLNDKGELRAARREGRRPHPVRQVVGHRGQARRRGAPDHEGVRHHGRPRRRRPRRRRPPEASPPRSKNKEERRHGSERRQVRRERPRADAARRGHPGRRGEGHARPEGPQRGARQELRRAADHQGRRDRRQGDRARRQVREHGRADGARGGLEDQRRRRRRHHHRDRAGPGDRPRGRQGGGRRHEPDGPQARHRQGRGRGRRRAGEEHQEDLAPRPRWRRSARSPPTATPRSAR